VPAAAPAGNANGGAAYVADLLITCPDQKGVVASLAQLLFGYGCNIISSDQHSDTAIGMYFQRIHFDYADMIVGPENVNVLENAMRHTAAHFDMTWSIHYASKCAALDAVALRRWRCRSALRAACKQRRERRVSLVGGGVGALRCWLAHGVHASALYSAPRAAARPRCAAGAPVITHALRALPVLTQRVVPLPLRLPG
jgi:hypothetical protein